METLDTNERIAVLENEVKNISSTVSEIRREQREQHNILLAKMEKVGDRISDIERWRWMVVGAAVVIGYIAEKLITKLF